MLVNGHHRIDGRRTLIMIIENLKCKHIQHNCQFPIFTIIRRKFFEFPVTFKNFTVISIRTHDCKNVKLTVVLEMSTY